MVDTPKIRTFAYREWKSYRDLRLRALADSPNAFGSTLAEELGRSDAEWSSRLGSGNDLYLDLPLVADVNREPIGLAWGRIDRSNPDVANLYQMWVTPSFRQHGIGQLLLEKVIEWARENNAKYLDLVITYKDSPAMRLYARMGFKPVGKPQSFRPDSELLDQSMRLKLRSSAAYRLM